VVREVGLFRPIIVEPLAGQFVKHNEPGGIAMQARTKVGLSSHRSLRLILAEEDAFQAAAAAAAAAACGRKQQRCPYVHLWPPDTGWRGV
jgi:hypothetical protein